MKRYALLHKDNWSRFEVDLDVDSDTHEAYYDKQNKKYFLNFQYDSFMSKVFSEDVSKSEASEYIKRLISYSICSKTDFVDTVKSLSEVSIADDSESTLIFNENIQNILKVNKINNEKSSLVFDFIFNKKNIQKIR